MGPPTPRAATRSPRAACSSSTALLTLNSARLSPGTFPTNTWRHFAVTVSYSNAATVLYANGASIASGTTKSWASVTCQSAFVGRPMVTGSTFFNGYVASLAVFPAVFTSGQVSSLYSPPPAPPPPPLPPPNPPPPPSGPPIISLISAPRNDLRVSGGAVTDFGTVPATTISLANGAVVNPSGTVVSFPSGGGTPRLTATPFPTAAGGATFSLWVNPMSGYWGHFLWLSAPGLEAYGPDSGSLGSLGTSCTGVGTPEFLMIRRYGGNNIFYFVMATGGSSASLTSFGDNLVTNAWRHMAVTISADGAAWKMYDGGSQNGAASPGFAMPAWPSCFVAHFGYNEVESMSSFQYYPYELSAAQARLFVLSKNKAAAHAPCRRRAT